MRPLMAPHADRAPAARVGPSRMGKTASLTSTKAESVEAEPETSARSSLLVKEEAVGGHAADASEPETSANSSISERSDTEKGEEGTGGGNALLRTVDLFLTIDQEMVEQVVQIKEEAVHGQAQDAAAIRPEPQEVSALSPAPTLCLTRVCLGPLPRAYPQASPSLLTRRGLHRCRSGLW